VRTYHPIVAEEVERPRNGLVVRRRLGWSPGNMPAGFGQRNARHCRVPFHSQEDGGRSGRGHLGQNGPGPAGPPPLLGQPAQCLEGRGAGAGERLAQVFCGPAVFVERAAGAGIGGGAAGLAAPSEFLHGAFRDGSD